MGWPFRALSPTGTVRVYYVLPIDLAGKRIIWEEFKGHRRALDKLADLNDPEDSLGFALFTVMASLRELWSGSRDQLSSQQAEEFQILLDAMWAYFDLRGLWHHATRRYTFTGFSEPSYLSGQTLAGNVDVLREWVLMRWHIWCSEVGIGYLVNSRRQGVRDYPPSVLGQVAGYYRLNLRTRPAEIEPWESI